VTKPIRFANSVLFGLMVLILTFDFCGSAHARPVTKRAELLKLSRSFAVQLDALRPQLYYDLLKSDAVPQRRLNENPDIQLMFINDRGCPVFYVW